MKTRAGRPITNFKKHGYCSDLEKLPWEAALKIFCMRRSNDIFKTFSVHLPFKLLLARIYLQGFMDGKDVYESTKKPEVCE